MLHNSCNWNMECKKHKPGELEIEKQEIEHLNIAELDVRELNGLEWDIAGQAPTNVWKLRTQRKWSVFNIETRRIIDS